MEKKIKLLSVEQAQRIIFKNIKPLKFKEKINIENSYKRVLRSNINSRENATISANVEKIKAR